MPNQDVILSKRLNRINLNEIPEEIPLRSYWCRVAFRPWEKPYTKAHSHSFWELHLCLTGNFQMETDQGVQTVDSGRFLLIPPRVSHIIQKESSDFSKFVWAFQVDEPQAEHCLLERYQDCRAEDADPAMTQDVREILENCREEAFGFYFVIKSRLYDIFLRLVRRTDCPDRGGRHFRRSDGDEASALRDYLYHNPFVTLEEAAAVFYASKSKLNRICKSRYGMAFTQLKRSLQAERIRELLRDSDCSLKQIASLTGFSDQYAMGKFFKRAEGMPPGAYRKSFRK